jgi:eukaryotic-like serine/threonine-protein kinase
MTVMLRASDLIAGRYRLESPVSEDECGELWEAADLVQGRPITVRLPPADDPPMLERFFEAARLAASVSHPSVAQVFDHGEGTDEEPPYLVTEPAEASSLAELLAVDRMEPARAMNVLAQAASGLQAAHEAGLVHGDISPANLLVDAKGDVKIHDFVVASCTQKPPVSSSPYVAPERADGSPATQASDLYSLGVVGYECLIGTAAFRRKTAKLAADPSRPLPALPRWVPAGVAGLIDDLTARDPAKRPASADRVSVRARLLRDTPVKSRDTKPTNPLLRRNRYRDVPTPAPTLLEQHTAILSAPVRAPDQAPPRRRPWWPLLVAAIGAVLAAGLAGWLLASAFTGNSPQHAPPARHGTPASTPNS